MPYLQEGTLHQFVKGRRVELTEILSVARQIADGLAAAHSCGLVHRDIKPSNILLQGGLDDVVLSDFGLARELDDQRSHSMLLAGTPQFMSPEQVQGLAIDTRSDLFSFGSLLYWLCTTQSPFACETSYGSLTKIAQQPHRPVRQLAPSVPSWLEQLIDQLLEKKPEDRIQSAAQLERILQGCLDHLRDPLRNKLPSVVTGRSFRTIKLKRIGLMAGLLVVSVGSLIAAVALNRQANFPNSSAGNEITQPDDKELWTSPTSDPTWRVA
jgi:serine/threonine-protein kinase